MQYPQRNIWFFWLCWLLIQYLNDKLVWDIDGNQFYKYLQFQKYLFFTLKLIHLQKPNKVVLPFPMVCKSSVNLWNLFPLLFVVSLNSGGLQQLLLLLSFLHDDSWWISVRQGVIQFTLKKDGRLLWGSLPSRFLFQVQSQMTLLLSAPMLTTINAK